MTSTEIKYILKSKLKIDDKVNALIRLHLDFLVGAVPMMGIFNKIDFPKLEQQRLALDFILAGADKEQRSQDLENGLEDLEGIQNLLDSLTDLACEVYGEEKVLPMMTAVSKLIDRDEEGAIIIQHPASAGKTKKDE